MNSLRNFTDSVAFYSKFTTLSNFSKKNTFSYRKTHIFFFNKTKFWKFWELLLFESHFTENLLPYANFRKNHGLFSNYPSYFFNRGHFFIFWTFWEVLLFQSHFTTNMLLLAFLKKIKLFSENPFIVFQKKTQFLNVLRTLLIQSHSRAKLAIFSSFFRKMNFFSKKAI